MNYVASMESMLLVIQEVSLARDWTSLLAVFRNHARQLIGAEGATFILAEGQNCYYCDEDAISPLWKGRRFPMEMCVSGWVIQNRRPVAIPDISKDERVPLDAYKATFVKSLAIVPIRSSAPIGAIGFYWSELHEASPQEIATMQALADSIAIAIENIQLLGDLSYSNALFQTFMQHAPFGAAMRDQQGRYLFVNEIMAQFMGRQSEDMLNKGLLEVTLPANAEAAKRAVDEDQLIIASKQRRSQTYISTDSDGKTRHLWVTKFPIFKENSEINIGVIAIDITQRVEAEQAQEKSRSQLSRSYKMAALGEMAGSIAHEITNPTAIVIGKGRQLVEVLSEETVDLALAQQFSQSITESAERIIAIVNGLKTISRKSEEDPFVTVDLKRIIDETVTLCSPKFSFAGISLSVPSYDFQSFISCRPAQISQVILNLLSNAFDAVVSLKDKWVSVDINSADDHVTIKIADSGSGIPFAIQKKIMDPFFTTKDFGKGTGLGLSISKTIVESHGGIFSFDSSSSHTCFVVRLPLARGKSPK